jgi:hypothetical protein
MLVETILTAPGKISDIKKLRFCAASSYFDSKLKLELEKSFTNCKKVGKWEGWRRFNSL